MPPSSPAWRNRSLRWRNRRGAGVLCASARTGAPHTGILGVEEKPVTEVPTIHTTMAELLARWPSARAGLARHGMACVGCPMARFETLGEAAAAYGLDARALLIDVTGRVDRRPGRRAKR